MLWFTKFSHNKSYIIRFNKRYKNKVNCHFQLVRRINGQQNVSEYSSSMVKNRVWLPQKVREEEVKFSRDNPALFEIQFDRKTFVNFVPFHCETWGSSFLKTSFLFPIHVSYPLGVLFFVYFLHFSTFTLFVAEI